MDILNVRRNRINRINAPDRFSNSKIVQFVVASQVQIIVFNIEEYFNHRQRTIKYQWLGFDLKLFVFHLAKKYWKSTVYWLSGQNQHRWIEKWAIHQCYSFVKMAINYNIVIMVPSWFKMFFALNNFSAEALFFRQHHGLLDRC